MDLFDLVAKITLDSSEYERGINGAMNAAGRFGKTSSAVFGAFMEIGRQATSTVFGAISSGMDGAVKRFDTLNNFPKVMQSLGFEASEAEKGINALADGIEYLPTTLDAVASQAQQFVPMTGNIQKAADVTLALNNAMAAGGKDAETQKRAIEAWTKAMAKGKPDFEAWNSMVQTAPAQMDQLAKSMLGASANQNTLYEAMKSGEVTMSEVNDTMIELTKNGGDGFASWAEQAENASAGIQMSFINVRAAIQRNLEGIMQTVDAQLGDKGIAARIQGLADVADKVGSTVQKVISGELSIGDVVKSAGESLKDLMTFDPSGIVESIGESLPSMIDAGLQVMEGFTGSIREGFGSFVSSGVEIIQSIAQGIAEAIPSLVEHVPQIITNIAGLINDNAPKLLAAGLNIIVTLGKGLIQAIPVIVANIPQIISAIWNAFTAFNWLALGQQLVTAIANGIMSLGTSLPEALRSLGQSAIQVFKNINWKDVGGSVIKLISNGIIAFASLPGQMLRKAASLAMKTFTSVSWGTVGKNVVQGIARGIIGGVSIVVNAIRSIAKRAVEAAKNALKIGSPSKVFANEVGKWIPEGLAQGIEKNMKVVNRASDAMANATLFAPSTEAGRGYSSGNSPVIYNTITVEGADSPEDFANRLVRQMQLDMRLT